MKAGIALAGTSAAIVALPADPFMFVGILQFELHIADAMSLKDKRRVVRSLKDRLHREHQVSVAEIGALDQWNVAVLGLAAVANTAARAGDVLDAILAKLHSLREAELAHFHREIVKGDAMSDRAIETNRPSASPFSAEERRQAEAMLRKEGG